MRSLVPPSLFRRFQVTAATYVVAWVGLFSVLAVDAQEPVIAGVSLPTQAPWVGSIEAREIRTLVAPHTGHVVSVSFAERARVAAGDRLLTITSSRAGDAVAEAQRELRAAQVASTQAAADFARVTRLTRREAASAEDVARRHARAVAARQRWLAVQQALRDARLNPTVITVRAPMSGVVQRSGARLNQSVDAGAALVTIVSNDVDVYFDVPASTTIAASAPPRVRFSLPESAQVFTGALRFVGPATTAGARRARLRLATDASLIPGRNGYVVLDPAPLSTPTALAFAGRD